MAGLYKTGDKFEFVYKAVFGDKYPLAVEVIAEEQPGLYRCQTDMGIAILIAEADLKTA